MPRLGLLGIVIFASASIVVPASASSTSSVPVVRCPTKFGVQRTAGKAPASLAVLGHPASTAGLAAYTNYEEFLVAPAGMKCSGEVGVDGNGSIIVWPAGRGPPTQHSHLEGLTFTLDPACASCRAADACPFFPKLAASLGFTCTTTEAPRGEDVYRLAADATLFEDPPGLAGDGWPSGGPDAANGIVGFNPNEDSSVYRSTCTLPQSEHSICTVSLNDVYARYGQSGPPQPTTPAKPSPPTPSSTLDVADFNGDKLAVTVAIFADPATPANQYESVPSGSRLVAIKETLTGLGPATITSDADSDTTLVGSNGQVYTPSFDDIQGCTNFDYGSFTLPRGESETGCVAFAVPNGISTRRVTFSLTDGSVDTAQWTAS